MTGRVRPSLIGQIVQRPGRARVHGQHDIVVGRITLQLTVVATTRVVRSVLGRVPAAAGQIDAAAERYGAVDDDDLLMQRRTRRAAIVVAEVHAPVRVPAELVYRGRFAAARKHQRAVPRQDVHLRVLLRWTRKLRNSPSTSGTCGRPRCRRVAL